MLTLKLNVRLSIFALLTVKVDLPSTVSSAPTEQFSTRTTSSVIGGLTSTAPKLKLLLLKRMLNLLLLERKHLLLQIKLLIPHLLMMLTLPELLEGLQLMKLLKEQPESLDPEGTTEDKEETGPETAVNSAAGETEEEYLLNPIMV